MCLQGRRWLQNGVADVGKRLVNIALLGIAFMIFVSGSVPVGAASSPVSVTGNILAESITNTAKGARIHKAIVRFKAGTVANFDSLTQILISEPGSYPVRFEIVGPDGGLRAYYDLMVSAATANWTHSELTHWRQVSFDAAGTYQFVVRVDRKSVASFPISASN